MSGVATAVVVGSAITADANKDAARAAAGQTPQFAPEIQREITPAIGRVKGQQITPFGGDRVANLTDRQNQALSMSDFLAQNQQGQAGLSAAGFGNFASGSMVGNNPFLEDSIRALRENSLIDTQRNQLPAIRNTAIAAGGTGGSRQGIAEGLALSDLNRTLVNQEAGMRQGQFNQDLAQQLQALLGQGQILSGQSAPVDTLMRSGGIEQGQAQAEIGGAQALHGEQQNLQFNRDQELLRILLGAPAAVPPVAAQTNPLAAGLGAGVTVDQLFNRPQQAPTVNVNQGTPGFTPNSTDPRFING